MPHPFLTQCGGRLTILAVLLLFLASGLCASAYAQPKILAVIYPDVEEPYKNIFDEIIAGIVAYPSISVKRYTLGKNFDSDNLRAWLDAEKPAAVITLGQRGLDAARTLDEKTPVVAGAVMLSDNSAPNIIGMSLTPHPAKLFAQLHNLASAIKRVHVVYTPTQNTWLIDLAKESVTQYNLELIAHPAQSLSEAALLYQDVMNNSNTKTDAVWLLSDKSLDEDAVLDVILKTAWDRKLVMFSSNLSHAKKGALFSLYPDNQALGRTLADMAVNHERVNGASITPLSDVRTAVNVRAAAHLQLSITPEQRRDFGLVFPAQ
ncbi:MAG: ABC transporter substrate binding protein [Pseudomonadota bacterium]